MVAIKIAGVLAILPALFVMGWTGERVLASWTQSQTTGGIVTAADAPDADSDGLPDDLDADDDNDGWEDPAEGQIGTSSIKPCGNDGWPAELSGSDNTLNIGDFNSFLFPLRGDDSFAKFGHPVPDADDANIARWNLQPDSAINIGDLNALNPAVLAPTARPPMFGGQPAFFTNGGLCPWPP